MTHVIPADEAERNRIVVEALTFEVRRGGQLTRFRIPNYYLPDTAPSAATRRPMFDEALDKWKRLSAGGAALLWAEYTRDDEVLARGSSFDEVAQAVGA